MNSRSLKTFCVLFFTPFVDWLSRSSTPTTGFSANPTIPFTGPYDWGNVETVR